MARLWIGIGAVAGLGGVALSAWLAHAGRGLEPGPLAAWGAAERMLLAHGPALVAAGVWARMRGGRLADWAAAVLAVGLATFCAAMAATARGVSLGPVAPVGGVLLLLGWGLLLGSAGRRPGRGA